PVLSGGRSGRRRAARRERRSGRHRGRRGPRLRERLCSPSGGGERAPPALVGDVARLRERLAGPQPELLLIGRRQLRSNNSWLHNVPTLVGGSNQCTLHVNPVDVARLGLNGRAVVRSAAGELVVPVE